VNGQTSIYNATEGGLPISGAPNITLREAINTFCSDNNRSRINALSIDVPKPKQLETIHSELIKQSEIFDKISQNTQKMQSTYRVSDAMTDDLKKKFVGKMDKFYQFILDQPDTLKLMQGYSYLGFIEWNQESSRISLKETMGEESEILADKFIRDKKILDILGETADSLRNAFKKMASEIN
jgi:hypothetical protein